MRTTGNCYDRIKWRLEDGFVIVKLATAIASRSFLIHVDNMSGRYICDLGLRCKLHNIVIHVVLVLPHEQHRDSRRWWGGRR